MKSTYHQEHKRPVSKANYQQTNQSNSPTSYNSKRKEHIKHSVMKISPKCPEYSTPGYMYLTNKEKSETLLQRQLNDAKISDVDFYLEKSSTKPTFDLSNLDDDFRRTKNIDTIKSDGFVQSLFMSSRSNKTAVTEKIDLEKNQDISHEKAIFGNTFTLKPSVMKKNSELDAKYLFHENIDEDPELRWNRWTNILKGLRKPFNTHDSFNIENI